MKQDKFFKKGSLKKKELENLDLRRKKKANKPQRNKDFKLEDFRSCNYSCEKICRLQRGLEEKNRNRGA